MKFDIKEIVGHFNVDGSYVSSCPWGSGHINDTFLVTLNCSKDGEEGESGEYRYTLQRINHFVFKNPVELMDNAMRVSQHIRKKIVAEGGDPIRQTLSFICTEDNDSVYIDPKGDYWRLYSFIEHARGYDRVERPEIAYECGRAFGQFQAWLEDFEGDPLHYTIEHFNDPPFLISRFEEVLATNSHNRAVLIKKEVKFVLDRSDEMQTLVRLGQEGKLPLRITHNDTKVNNVLIDINTDKATCVIDLDTLMPGFALNDFGDSIRTATNTGEEDDADLSRVGIDLDFFESYARGYLTFAKRFLTKTEQDYLAFSGKLYAYLIGLRFLTDYLDGDQYFKIHHEHHNLQRARAQFKLLQDMEKNYDEMKLIVKRVYREV